MAVPALANQVGLELLASDPPETMVLSYGGLATVAPLLPARVNALLKAQLDVFRQEVALPVMSADSVEEALQRMAARSDVVNAVSCSVARVLLDSVLRSETLQTALAELPAKFVTKLRASNLRWLGRTSALTLEGAFGRNSVISALYFQFFQHQVRGLPALSILTGVMGQPTYGPLQAQRLSTDGLLLSVAVAAEEAQKQTDAIPASRVVRGLVDELWRAVHHHERAMLRWMVDCLRQFSPGIFGFTPTPATNALLQIAQARLDVSTHFAELRQEWHASTGHLSNPNQIIAHPAYQAIIELGWEVVPFVLGALEQDEPDFWGPALHQLTGEEPPLPEGAAGNLEAIAQAWLELARKRGWRIGGGRAG